MTAEVSEFMPRDRQLFDRSMGELLAEFYRRRFPRDTAKRVARHIGLEPPTAANLVKGHASERTITKALKAEGWPLIMALGEAVTGATYADHLQDIIHETERARTGAAIRRNIFVSLEARAAELVALHGRPLDEPAWGGAGSDRPEADGVRADADHHRPLSAAGFRKFTHEEGHIE